DAALPEQTALVAHLEHTLGARVHAAVVQRVDMVNDTTVVDVRYRVTPGFQAKGGTTAHAEKTAGPANTATAVAVRP
ncbi:DUF4956 domain-containing protein, partial [Streptomyces sp. NPDC048845]